MGWKKSSRDKFTLLQQKSATDVSVSWRESLHVCLLFFQFSRLYLLNRCDTLLWRGTENLNSTHLNSTHWPGKEDLRYSVSKWFALWLTHEQKIVQFMRNKIVMSSSSTSSFSSFTFHKILSWRVLLPLSGVNFTRLLWLLPFYLSAWIMPLWVFL